MAMENKPCQERFVKVCMQELEIWIDAPPEVVWRKAVLEVNTWWQVNLHENSLGIFIEPQVGGRFWEQFGSPGHGVMLGTVSFIDEPNTIHFSASSGMAGIALGANTWRFLHVDGGTLFQFSFEIMTEYPERCLSDTFAKKTRLLLESLKKYVEGGRTAETG